MPGGWSHANTGKQAPHVSAANAGVPASNSEGIVFCGPPDLAGTRVHHANAYRVPATKPENDLGIMAAEAGGVYGDYQRRLELITSPAHASLLGFKVVAFSER